MPQTADMRVILNESSMKTSETSDRFSGELKLASFATRDWIQMRIIDNAEIT